jgi:hypothetical protein
LKAEIMGERSKPDLKLLPRRSPLAAPANRPPLYSSFKGVLVMTKKSRKELAREILARVKREMDKPRLTASVRNSESGLTAPAVTASALR